MTLTANELYYYIKRNGITKVKLTESLHSIPKDTILWMGVNKNCISSLANKVYEMNKEFNYPFDVNWCTEWHDSYKGKFEIVKDKTKGLNFLEAIELMKQGKKVKRKSFSDNSRYLWLSKDSFKQILDSKYTTYDIDLESIESTDWEEFKEKKIETLTDKRIYIQGIPQGSYYSYPEEHLKQTIKNIKQELDEAQYFPSAIFEIFDKHFGREFEW